MAKAEKMNRGMSSKAARGGGQSVGNSSGSETAELFARGMSDQSPGRQQVLFVFQAVEAGYAALDAFNQKMREKGREVLAWCARERRPD